MRKNTLTQKLTVQLADAIRAEYTSSTLHDGEFAALLSKRLGSPISERNVEGLRRNLDIKSRREVLREAEPSTVLDRLARLEAFLDKLEPKWRSQLG